MLIRALPLVAGIVPVAGIFLSYWLAVENGVLPACSPFLDGCVSISATGRYMPGSLLFRAAMLPQSVLLLMVWYLASLWLRNLAPASRAPATIMVAGVIGALALVLYVTFLGTKAPFYEFMRRFGIYFYFLGTAIAQVTLAVALLKHARQKAARELTRLSVGMLLLCGVSTGHPEPGTQVASRRCGSLRESHRVDLRTTDAGVFYRSVFGLAYHGIFDRRQHPLVVVRIGEACVC